LNDIIGQGKEINLRCIHAPENKLHRHAVIAVSGFLSQKEDSVDSWIYLTSFCRARDIPLYVLCWESKDKDELVEKTK
jgi:hypothetical protein